MKFLQKRKLKISLFVSQETNFHEGRDIVVFFLIFKKNEATHVSKHLDDLLMVQYFSKNAANVHGENLVLNKIEN